MERIEVINLVDKKLRQAIALANHVKASKGTTAFVSESYVEEKSTRTPVLDRQNAAVYDLIIEHINAAYGLDLAAML